MSRTFTSGVALLVLACSASCKPGSTANTPSDSSPGPVNSPVILPKPAVGPLAYVSSLTLLRREPSEDRKVTAGAHRGVTNVLATLQRGEKISLVQEGVKRVGEEEWVKVRSSDDQEGFLKRSSLLEGDGITEATVLAPADVFDRPDLLAANASRKLEPATLLLVVRSKEPFSEVNVAGGPDAWVLTDRLTNSQAEVSIAKLTEKALWLRRSGKPDEAAQLLGFARAQFPGTPLLEAMAAQLGEAPAAANLVPGGVAPTPAPSTGNP